MTLPYAAEPSHYLAKMLNVKKERFVKLCLQWDSARDLADDLALIGYEASERTVSNWRSRSFKRVPYNAVQAVKYLIELKKIEASRQWSAAIKEAQSL